MGTDRAPDPQQRDLEPSRVRRDTGYLTTQHGVGEISDYTRNSASSVRVLHPRRCQVRRLRARR